MVDKDWDELWRADQIVDCFGIEVSHYHWDWSGVVLTVQYSLECLRADQENSVASFYLVLCPARPVGWWGSEVEIGVHLCHRTTGSDQKVG